VSDWQQLEFVSAADQPALQGSGDTSAGSGLTVRLLYMLLYSSCDVRRSCTALYTRTLWAQSSVSPEA
jgi:hypothetical protein